ncbi:cell division protein FtsA [Bacillaceae bacterium Marseille-Q3522]|nr:cell division protein FtsA [Bacillaceae bacterium Marseille-Q3522]
MQKNNKLFALDIGTRSVVGIILEETDGRFHVLDIFAKEHRERAMLDGQIHDVLAVSQIIKEIKTELEKKYGPLKKVCVAAAGRALKTERSTATMTIRNKPMMQKQDILHLELSAVQLAQSSVAQKHEQEKSVYYYCVGYSVLYYRLDGEEIGNLTDQQGDEASVEIIATFLPKVVVESLIAALHRADLEMEALTLEPIAAINVLIPPSMRRLNVALVDIGAGTSDIAITNSGTVTAYGMVPVAGDEITEAISEEFLLDFPLAEQVKRKLSTQSAIQITDILGYSAEIGAQEAVTRIGTAIDRLAASICDEILSLNNHKPPKAVMLVGGGSLTPRLPEKIARYLQLPENRIAIRGLDAISSLTMDGHLTKGPELVTPIGIAIAAKKAPVQYRTVYVNEQPVRLFEVNKLTVGDCLLAAGINMAKLYGKPGMAKIISLNGKNITIPGTYGEAPLLTKNKLSCGLDDEIANNDVVTVTKGKDGKQTSLQIKELVDGFQNRTVKINQQEYRVPPDILRNQQAVSADAWIEDRDQVSITFPETIGELLQSVKREDLLEELRPFQLTVNGKETIIPSFSAKIYRNGMETKIKNSYQHLDNITIVAKTIPTVQHFAQIKQKMLYYTIPVTFNGENIHLTKHITVISRNGNALRPEDILYHGDSLHLTSKNFEPFIFQDLFSQVEIEIPKTNGGKFVLMKNGQEAAFQTKLDPGDNLKIIWHLVREKK